MTENLELELLEELGSFAYDPYGFVMWAFPWGVPGTDLAKEQGPEDWQKELLILIRDNIISVEEALLIAVASGHGIGKSAFVAWIVWWAFSTFPGTRGVVTANTENQLKTKTWVEIAKWHRLFIAKDMFKVTATALFALDKDHKNEWRVDIVPWSEKNLEAFAGLHNHGKRILVVFDEASGIPDLIWETTEGTLTDEDTEIIWAVFGNPTRDDLRFRDCFPGGKFEKRWHNYCVDSRSVRRTNKRKIGQWEEDYGEDSDFFRVRVKGMFPRQSAQSFFSVEVIEAAQRRNIPLGMEERAIILGVDVARFGDDRSIIVARRGRDMRSIPPIILPYKTDTMTLAETIVLQFNACGAAVVCVDGTGVGGGVVDRLRQLKIPVVDVQFQSKPKGLTSEPHVRYGNTRSEIYGALREWLVFGAVHPVVPNSEHQFLDEAKPLRYTHRLKDDAIMLEPKDIYKNREGFSPDLTDAYALTFATPEPNLAPRIPRKPENYNPLTTENIYGTLQRH
jgi:hypothetical protein